MAPPDEEPIDRWRPQPTTAPDDLGDHRDELPSELDAAGFVGPYLFPDNRRRRIPAVLYAVADVRVLPEPLDGTWAKLRAAWPA